MTEPCQRCSYGTDDGGLNVYHGVGTVCDRDPELATNIITAHFRDQCPNYVGIVWQAIANGAVRALGWTPGITVVIGPDGHLSEHVPVRAGIADTETPRS